MGVGVVGMGDGVAVTSAPPLRVPGVGDGRVRVKWWHVIGNYSMPALYILYHTK